MNIIGIDVGHSSVKLAADVQGKVVTTMIPTFVCPAVSLSDEAEQARAILETIELNGIQYFFGETARLQGQMRNPTGSFDDWISTPQHTVLLLASFDWAAKQGLEAQNSVVLLGLPSNLFMRQKAQLKQLVQELTGAKQVIVMPQPVGLYQAMMLDAHGFSETSRDRASQTWGMIDAGYYSTDFIVVEKGRMVEDSMQSCPGMRRASEYLLRTLSDLGFTADIREAENTLRTRTIRDYGKDIDVGAKVDAALALCAAEVVDTYQRQFSRFARTMDGLVIAGGGANALYPFVQQAYRNAFVAPNPRLAVAEGLRRYGCALRRIKASESSTNAVPVVGVATR